MKKYFKNDLLSLFEISKVNIRKKYGIEKLDEDQRRFYYDNYPVNDIFSIVDNLSDSSVMDLMIIIKNNVKDMYDELFKIVLSKKLSKDERIKIIKIYKLYLTHREIFIPDSDESSGIEDLISDFLKKKISLRDDNDTSNNININEIIDLKFGLDKIKKIAKKYHVTINKNNAKYIIAELEDLQYTVSYKYNKFDIDVVDVNNRINKVLVKRFN